MTKLQDMLALFHGEESDRTRAIVKELGTPDSEASQILESMRDELAHTLDRDWSRLDEGDGFADYMRRLRKEAAGKRKSKPTHAGEEDQ